MFLFGAGEQIRLKFHVASPSKYEQNGTIIIITLIPFQARVLYKLHNNYYRDVVQLAKYSLI